MPNGQALSDKANKVLQANTAGIQSTRNNLQKAADQALDSHNSLVQTMTGLSDAWQGKDADAFSGYMDKFTQTSKSAHELLGKGIAGLDQAVKNLDDAKAEMNTALSHVVDQYEQQLKAAQAAATRDNPVTVEQKTSLANAAISAYEPQVDAALEKSETAMKQIAQDLHVHVDGLDKQFSVLTHPKTTVYSPTKNKNVDYRSRASSSGGSGGGGGGGASSGSSSGDASSSGAPSGPVPPGNVQDWIKQAIAILQQSGVPVTDANIQTIWGIIQHESGGNPHAINLWDSNAVAGHPSKGLMQCIDSTFNSNKLPGHNDIYNPVDNIIAGVRYSISRYGSLDNVPGVKAIAHGGHYVGY
jgi:uncharacterized protein YukE